VAHARVSATTHLKHKTKSERVPAAAFRVSKKQACFDQVLGLVCCGNTSSCFHAAVHSYNRARTLLFTRKLDLPYASNETI